jgi:hypothetical protein
MKELVMTPKQDDNKKFDPTLKDVKAGSDADATPVPEIGKTPPNPNDKK